MRLNLYQPPDPIIDPVQRIGYLRNFLSVVGPSISRSAYFGYCEKIRSDMHAITNVEVRGKAQDLFQKVLSAGDFVGSPEGINDWVVPSIQNLIAYLEQHDR